jgi:selenocysteine lyase/cysteine desulfurase
VSTTSQHQASATLPAAKSDFIGLRGALNLASGGEPPMLIAHRMSFEQFCNDKAAGYAGYHRHWDVARQVREQLGQFMHLPGEQIARLGNCSDAIARVVGSFDWQRSDNVVVSALDYASGRYALSGLQRHGVEVRLVPARGWNILPEDLLARCDDHTRLVYVSQVTSLTGQHLDIASLSEALSLAHTALLVDASHALGVVPVRADLADFTVSSCYKFALGVHDGVLAWNQCRRPDFNPASAGWWSAEPGADPLSFAPKPGALRAEYGNVNHLGTYILRESLDYLAQFGIDQIASHVRKLSGQLIEGMQSLGLEVITPISANQRAASAAFVCHDMDIIRRAAELGTLIWGDNNRVRASAHLFTSESDVAKFLEQLPALLSAKTST